MERKDIKSRIITAILVIIFILVITAFTKSVYVALAYKHSSIEAMPEESSDIDSDAKAEQQLQEFEPKTIIAPTVEPKPEVDLSQYNISKGDSDEYVMNIYQDLSCQVSISEKQIQTILEYWCGDSGLNEPGVASAFIYASQITGYDPLFLVSLAGYESGWGSSSIHVNKANVYSVGMTGNDDGFVFGDSLPIGIINGAIYIHNTYYEEANEKCLYDMQYGYLSYATDVNWMASINSIINESYYILNSGE